MCLKKEMVATNYHQITVTWGFCINRNKFKKIENVIWDSCILVYMHIVFNIFVALFPYNMVYISISQYINFIFAGKYGSYLPSLILKFPNKNCGLTLKHL